MWVDYFIQTFLNESRLAIVFLFFFLSLVSLSFFFLAKDQKIKLLALYSHIILLILPVILTVLLWDCGIRLLECTEKKILLLLPLGLTVSYIFSYFVAPFLYQTLNKKNEITSLALLTFIHAQALRLSIPVPRVYLSSEKKNDVYSYSGFKPFIFIPSYALSILHKKELEAVLLHELYHIHQKASFIKFSTLFIRKTSPLLRFVRITPLIEKLEREADTFAIRTQRTPRYLLSAQHKL